MWNYDTIVKKQEAHGRYSSFEIHVKLLNTFVQSCQNDYAKTMIERKKIISILRTELLSFC